MCFSVAIVKEEQLRKLHFVDSEPGQKITHFNYMGDDSLKQRGESHQDRNKRIIFIFFLKVVDSRIKNPLSLPR